MTDDSFVYVTESTEKYRSKRKRPFMARIPRPYRRPFIYAGWLLILALITLIFFGLICRPGIINGSSMEPTYPTTGLLFHSPLLLKMSELKRGDVVTIRYGNHRVMLLKRVIAFEGELVEFRDGVCYVDGIEQQETYIHKPCHWNLSPRIVQKGYIYVVGDNRSMNSDEHIFGQVKQDLLQGKALW